MKKITCVFCGQEKNKSKEHIWPRWLQIHLTGSTRSRFAGNHIGLSSARVISHRNQSGESLVFGNVCEDCNNGWMNELEKSFNPIFKQIQMDYSLIERLSKQQRKAISLWAFKTALMINSGSNYRQLVPPSHYNTLFEYKQIPKNVKIDITTIKNGTKLNWIQGNIVLSLITNGKDYIPNYEELTKASYVISMQIDNLSLKVIYYKNCKEMGYSLPIAENNLSLRISPYAKNGKFKANKGYNELFDFQLDTHLIR